MTNSNEQQAKDGFVPFFGHLGRKDQFKLTDHPELKMAEYQVKISSPKKKKNKAGTGVFVDAK